ncbi:hypothetical protein COOONC_06019 [Cooperia oncophora]
MPLVLTFVDYKKAFDSVEPMKVWESLEEQGIEKIYIDVLQESSEMLDRLDQEGSQYGLTMNTSKTKVMRNRFAGGATVTLKGAQSKTSKITCTSGAFGTAQE